MAFLAARGSHNSSNKFSPWAKSASIAAIFGALGSIVGALGVFANASTLANPAALTQANAGSVLIALLGMFFYGTGTLWFAIALMGFGYQASKEVRRQDATMRWKPYWAWLGWFVPVLSLFVPYLVFRDIILGTKSARERSNLRSLAAFWILWTLVLNSASYALGQVQTTSSAAQYSGWAFYASVMAVHFVPFMMGRALVKHLDDDLRAKTATAVPVTFQVDGW